MMKKILILLISIFLLSCGTDKFYSSFYVSKELDFNWMLAPSEQSDLNYKTTVIGTGDFRFNSPSIIGTSDSYILFFYEKRNNNNNKIIGVDGVNKTEVNVAISQNAQSFTVISQKIGNSSFDSHGSPISFINRNLDVVVLAVGGNGFGNSGSDVPSIISKSVSVPKSGYRVWTDWEDLDTNTFEPLLTNGYDRFYTSPDSGITLGNGTLVCIIDYKKKTDNNAVGFAILYSKDNGETWQIGAKTTYDNHRFAKIITERNDGKLIVAAVENSDNNYNKQANLAWFLVDSLEGNITSFSPNGLTLHNCGSTAGGKIRISENGYAKNAILLLHSSPNRETINPNGVQNFVKNANALYISFDEGKNWKIITNIFYPLTKGNANGNTIYFHDDYDNMSSFRQSLRILKDGTIATVSENGGYVINTSGQNVGFKLVYRRFSLENISDGKYRYEGF